MKKNGLKWIAVAAAVLMTLALAACGGSGSGGSAEKEPADPKEKFVGEWQVAAAEYESILMAGKFGEFIGTDDGKMEIKEDGTGSITLEDEVKLKWTLNEEDENAIDVKFEKKTEMTKKNVKVEFKDDALFMRIKSDGKTGALIFTKDGKYEKAKEIDLDKAEKITDKDWLIGKWTLSGFKMSGVSMTGEAEDLKTAMGDVDVYVEIKKDGSAEMSGSKGKWYINKKGAFMHEKDSLGEHEYPMKKLGDEMVFDMSEAFNMELVALMKKDE